ncbi:hypothetical protein RSSM_05027 [Rhodopirellula sallentina SM41]|uniref:Uncharacterized protein n=1 Tax=Rhodopirellula sallentina SM41 TaxID=1263870 RepID=M5TWG8_9BACT|nr:hypothetical protein RSSM_05027 [Rhodopirellula sallentina SM41]
MSIPIRSPITASIPRFRVGFILRPQRPGRKTPADVAVASMTNM